jgi:hypothetical protein
MEEGGEPQNRLAELYGQQREVYRSLLDPAEQQAELERQRRATKSQVLFDIANTALAFASPGSRSGMTPAERLAEAAQQTQLFDRISQRTGALEASRQAQAAEGRALDLAALQSASGLQSAEFAASLQPRSAESVNGIPRDIFDNLPQDAQNQILGIGEENEDPDLALFVDRTNPENVLVLDLSTPEGRQQVGTLGPNFVPVTTPSLSDLAAEEDNAANITTFVDRTNPENIRRFDLGTKEGREQANALGENFLPTTTPSFDDLAGGAESPLGNSFDARLLELVSDTATMEAYADGTLDQTDPSKAALITNTLTAATQARPVWDQTSGREVLMPAMQLSDQVLGVIERRKTLGLPVPTLGENVGGPQTGAPAAPNAQGRVKFLEDGTIDFSSFENDPTFIISGVDLTQSQDWTSGVNRFFNAVAGQLQPILGGSGYSGESGRITSEADTQLDRLANEVMRIVRNGTDGRIFALDAELLANEVSKFRPGFAKTDNGARDALVTTRNALASSWSDAQIIINNPSNYDRGTVTQARILQAQVERLLAETTAAVAVYDRFITGSSTDNAAADRAALSPPTVTGSLPRASGSN